MNLFIERRFVFSTLALITLCAGTGTFSALNALARERESSGMLVFSQGLFRKLPDGNALFSSVTISNKGRRAVLMLAREPTCEAELKTYENLLTHYLQTLPPGDFLFLIDDSEKIILQREIPKTRKIFELADEIKILFSRLQSVPVNYFPIDRLRGKVRTDIYEGNAAFPVPASKGGAQ